MHMYNVDVCIIYTNFRALNHVHASGTSTETDRRLAKGDLEIKLYRCLPANKHIICLRKPWPCNPAAETALQTLVCCL